MRWQTAKELLSSRVHEGWKRVSLAGLGGLLALRLAGCATAEDGVGVLPVEGTGGMAPPAAFCGNGLVEVGETCDGMSTPTCGAATMGAKSSGVVGCNACQVDVSGCQSSGTGGMTATGGAMGTGAAMGGSATPMYPPPGAGSTMGSGGTLGSGGTSAM
jgi:hypothetical protein